MLASFKHKLALYFLLLAVAPLTAAFWGFGTVAKRAEERRVDARLGAELRAVFASYERRADHVKALARNLARRRDIQQGLRVGRFSPLLGDVALVGPHRLAVGRRGTIEATQTVRVKAGRRVIGSILAVLPLDRSLLRQLRLESGLSHGDRIVFVPRSRSARRPLASGRSLAISVAGSRYRALATGPLSEQPNVQIAVLAPAQPIAAQAATTRRHLLYVLLGALLVLAAIAAAEARSVMRSLRELSQAALEIGRGGLDRRVPVRGRDEFADLAGSFNSMADQLRARLLELELQRTRLRESLSRTGELLTATHDIDQLLALIASAAVEAADAEGAALLGENGAVIEVGTLADDAKTFELPIASRESRFGILILYTADLDEDNLLATRALVAQGANALENACLHEAAARQARSDGLTGLANRRHCEERLVAEISRSERYETPLAVILCDIDEFKAANDSHGHAFGDLVLQRFADVLRGTLRDIDLSSRWGGEEFLIVLPGTTLEGAVEAAERIRTALAELELVAGAVTTVMTASFGIAKLAEGMDAFDLVRAADEALYEAKSRGKNCVSAAAETGAPGAKSAPQSEKNSLERGS
ncbi:MAG: diguanylate cyclase [Actinobacteria bacterium]|nr:MAG: diguanylate cyclase [Actinomycetota bacterium]